MSTHAITAREIGRRARLNLKRTVRPLFKDKAVAQQLDISAPQYDEDMRNWYIDITIPVGRVNKQVGSMIYSAKGVCLSVVHPTVIERRSREERGR